MMTDEGRKILAVGDLLRVLVGLPCDARVEVNQLGNLKVTDEQDQFLGYIDFMDGGFHEAGVRARETKAKALMRSDLDGGIADGETEEQAGGPDVPALYQTGDQAGDGHGGSANLPRGVLEQSSRGGAKKISGAERIAS